MEIIPAKYGDERYCCRRKENSCQHKCVKNKDNQLKCYNKNNNYINIYTPEPTPPPEKENVFAQLFDPNLTATLTEPGYIQLISTPSALKERGGFSVTTTTIDNDTFNIPSTGVYLLNFDINYSFLPPINIVLGTFYQVVINVESDNIQSFIPSIDVNTGITTAETISSILSRSLILNVPSLPASFRLNLLNFNFNVSFNNSIQFYTSINAVKISDIPLT